MLLLAVPCFGEDPYAPGAVIVKFRSGTVNVISSVPSSKALSSFQVQASSVQKLNSQFAIQKMVQLLPSATAKVETLRSGKVIQTPDLSQIYLLKFPATMDVKSMVAAYRSDPNVEYAFPDHIKKISTTTPNDPFYTGGNQWALTNIWLTPLESNKSGWDITKESTGIRIAVIDTGVNYNHNDLSTNIDQADGKHFFNEGSVDTDVLDDNGHGTHVSGIIGAITNNGYGVAGVNWNCIIIPIKAFDADGNAYTSDIIQALNWAMTKEANVINMSFGGSDDDMSDIINTAALHDIVLVAAAGNSSNSSPNYPAADAPVIAVAATGPEDCKAFYSSFGPWVSISAPGGDDLTGFNVSRQILSTWPFNSSGNLSNTSFAYLQGTSMAAPFVTGAAALVRSRFGLGMTAAAVKQQLINYSDNIDHLPGNSQFVGQLGRGRLNVFAALGGLYGYIANPASGSTGFGNVAIIGSVTGEGFDHYRVDYGIGSSPTTWTTLETSSTPELNSVLAVLNTTGINDYVTVRLIVNDLPSTEVTSVFHAGTSDPAMITSAQTLFSYGPNPFNPLKGPILIKYALTANANVSIYFFDVTGNLICRKSYPSGTNGGQQGDNRVYWDGMNDYGEMVANGVYLFRIAAEGRVVGKGKIVVLK